MNSTYYYYILVTDSVGNSNKTSEDNFTMPYYDLFMPVWQNISVYPPNNTQFNQDKVYQFNVSWEDYNLSSVWIEHNFNGSLKNYSVVWNNSNVFYYNYTGLAAGSYL